MGHAKRMIEDEQTRIDAATEIAVRVGLLTRCEFCEDVKDPLACNHEDAYKLGNYLFSRGDELVSVFESRTEMTDTIKDICTHYGEQCHCEYMLSKDD